MKATVSWNGGLAFTGSSSSGFPVRMDADASQGGNNTAVRPMEMIAIGLAGCTAMDVLSILQKKRQDITFFDVSIDAPRSPEYPKVFTSAMITFVLAGLQIQERALLRAIELSVTKYCAAHAMLAQAFPIDLYYEIYEDEGNGNRRLMHQGIWQETLVE